MSYKTPFSSWIGMDLEAGWCSGAVVNGLDKMHIISNWDIKIPAKRREQIWAQNRGKPVATNILPKNPADIPITTSNVWSFRPLYLLLGGGSFSAVGSTGIISQDSGMVLSFAIQEYRNGDHRAISGCVMDEVSLVIPKDGGNLNWEWKAVGADYSGTADATNPGQYIESLRGQDGTYSLTSGGNSVSDRFLGGKITFRNNLVGTSYGSAPDVSNGRILKPALGNLEVNAELSMRIDTNNAFSQAWENHNTGIFNLNWIIKNENNTGCVLDISGFQLDPDGYTEPVPTAQEGVIEMTINLIQSEDFILKDIQITGIDFS